MIYCDDLNIEALANELAPLVLGEVDSFNTIIDIDVDPELDVEAYVIEIDKGEFQIAIRDNVENFRTAIAHELVHVKQYLDGRLACEGGSMFWEGKRIDTNKVIYSELPWEVEAHKLESTF